MKRKICVVTGTRAEYGLLVPLIKEILCDKDLELQIIATGSHLSTEFGYTYTEIEQDFHVDKKIEIVLSSDTSVGVAKSMGLAQISFCEAFDELKPDIVVIMGDRYEILAVAATAMICKIPIAHLSGGELTIGVIDDAIRHAITKMSHIHFVATDEYKKRVIQMGEDEKFVFNVGEIGLDGVLKTKLLNKDEFEKSINFKLNKKNILFTYHPTTLDDNITIRKNICTILEFLDTLKDTNIIFTSSNQDMGGSIINTQISNFVNSHNNSILFKSLGRHRYLSALQYVDAVVGNTSSGIVETPMFKIGTINIGNRQDGRVMSQSVINCDPNGLKEAFKKLYSNDFQKMLKDMVSPYYCKNSAKKCKDVLKQIDLTNILLKRFVDIK